MDTEKREHARRQCELESSYKNLDEVKPGHPAETVIRDISEGGIRFRVNDFVSVHNKLLFKISRPRHRSIEALAQPAWIRESPNINQYDIGSKFLSLSDEDREVLRQFAASLPVSA